MPEKLTLVGFINRSNVKHGFKYDYSQVAYINNYTKVKIGCPTHEPFEQRPKDHLSWRWVSQTSQILTSP
jgi:hypothetical protein